jgi:hypothetical protein
MKKLKESPAHMKEAEEDPEETEAMRFGSAYHLYNLQKEKFEEEYYVFDDSGIYSVLIGEGFKSPRSTKQYKEWMESEMRLDGDRKTISKDWLSTIKAMNEKLMRHPYVRMLLAKGINEQGYKGTIDTEAGVIPIKFKPDHINDGKKFVVDLKTAKKASKEGFEKAAAEMSYHIQAAFYADMLEHIAGDNRPYTFFFIAQEKVAPYAFNIFESSPQFISQGRFEYEMLLQLYKYCTDNKTWPGYQIWCENKYGILELKLPPWAIKDLTYYDHLQGHQIVSKQLELTN